VEATAVNLKRISHLGAPMNVEWWEAGTGGPPMLLLHGADGFSASPPYAELLSQGRRVIAAHHPGFGNTERPDWLDSISDVALFYLELLEAEDLADVTLVGFSSGGWVAAEMAVWRPERIGRMVLVDAVGIRVGGPTERDIADIFAISREERARLGFVDPALASRSIDDLSDEELGRLMQAEEMTALYCWAPYMCNPKLLRRLASVQTPSAVIWGAQDQVVAVEYGRAYAEALPNSEFHVVDGATHCPHIERPEAFCRLVDTFVARTLTASA
jgi:pimeloyl-ACP methyl ester carboxylesterase